VWRVHGGPEARWVRPEPVAVLRAAHVEHYPVSGSQTTTDAADESTASSIWTIRHINSRALARVLRNGAPV
jgi:hypothetical protein